MSDFFGKLVRTAVNVGVGLPVALVTDVLTLGGAAEGGRIRTAEKLQQIKDEASE